MEVSEISGINEISQASSSELEVGDMSESGSEKAFAGIDAKKRATLMRFTAGSAFLAPVVVSFAMEALTIPKAHAANGSGKSPPPPAP